MAKIDDKSMAFGTEDKIDDVKCRYPHAIVWTPIPILT